MLPVSAQRAVLVLIPPFPDRREASGADSAAATSLPTAMNAWTPS